MEQKRAQFFTVPNLLSLLRLCLIPLFVGLYLNGQEGLTALVLLFSGLTDVVDGWYARRFNAITDIGKVLDPIADKLTQAAMLLCLVTRYPAMQAPFLLLVVKEAFSGISGLIVIRRTGKVLGALWHGKLTTLLLYAMMLLHVIWQEIPLSLSNTLITICVVMMVLSLVLYGWRNFRVIRQHEPGKA